MTSLLSPDAAVNAAAPPPSPPLRLQTVIVSGASLRRLMRATGLRVDPQTSVAIVGVGEHFPKASGIDWCAACDELPPANDLTFPDLRDLVVALMSASDFLHVDGDAESVEALYDL